MLPMGFQSVTPYAATCFPEVFEQHNATVPTITVERTFWEKLTILHAEAHRPIDKALPSRYARHYYDVHKLVEAGVHTQALAQPELLAKVVAFKEKFYPSGWANYGSATLGGLVLLPADHHIQALEADYNAMQEMLFGDKPSFDTILKTLNTLQTEIHSLQYRNR